MSHVEKDVGTLVGSEFFDAEFYARQAGEEFTDANSAARHYLDWGAKRGILPSHRFDAHFYIRRNLDVAESGVNPLLHFLEHGQREGRLVRTNAGAFSAARVARDMAAWTALAQQRRGAGSSTGPVVCDIIVPVYRGFDDTLACLYSVLTSTTTTFYELVVVDDRGPDQRLRDALARIAAMGLFTLIQNPSNLGFVRSVNTGMALHPDRDVLLLNSDTVVYGDWLDRILRHAAVDPRIGTITPWSNNATIMSYPRFCQSNRDDLEMAPEEIDRLVAEIFPGLNIDVPTGVGFCFYIRRALIDTIGLFDFERFGRGYGEENDFCLRAAEAGWRNVCSLDVYVRHEGEVSFGADASGAQQVGLTALVDLYPGYLGLIDDFIRADPMQGFRQILDVERVRRWCDGRAILFIEHTWGGGIERHTSDLAAFLIAGGHPVVHLKPDGPDRVRCFLPSQANLDCPNMPSLSLDRPADAAVLLSNFGFRSIHIHSLVSFHEQGLDFISYLLKALDLPYYFTVHDYLPICPRITMTDWGGVFCDTPSVQYCQYCVDSEGTRFGPVVMEKWRAFYNDLFEEAQFLFVPNRDVKDRMLQFFPQSRILVRPHHESLADALPVWSKRSRSADVETSRVIGIVGAIGPHKGSEVILALVISACLRNLPLSFLIYGYTNIDDLLQFDNVKILGAYKDNVIDQIIASSPCDLMLFPSVWPETYCYALTIALRNGIFPVCFDIGAQAERIRRLNYGRVLGLDYIDDADRLADELVEMPIQPMPPEVYHQLRQDAQWPSTKDYYAL